MEGVKPKKWDVQKLQESKKIKQKYQRKIEEKIREYKEGNRGKLEQDRKSNKGSSR
jgi:hypothetical protein